MRDVAKDKASGVRVDKKTFTLTESGGRYGLRTMLANLAALAAFSSGKAYGKIVRWNLRPPVDTIYAARQAEHPVRERGNQPAGTISNAKRRRAQRAARAVRMARKRRRGWA